MIRVGFGRRWTFSLQTRNRGIRWIPHSEIRVISAATNSGINKMPKITPFLWFDDQAEEAVKFYTFIFKNSKIGKTLRYGEEAYVGK
jgi:3-demethylubiquinone-9 3-methyltransferase